METTEAVQRTYGRRYTDGVSERTSDPAMLAAWKAAASLRQLLHDVRLVSVLAGCLPCCKHSGVAGALAHSVCIPPAVCSLICLCSFHVGLLIIIGAS